MPDPVSQRLSGITWAKQFPNPAEPIRGLFVAEQVRATRAFVDWRVIAPVPWVPPLIGPLLGHQRVPLEGRLEGIPVVRPRYLVLPRRILYTSVARAISRASRGVFERALAERRPDFVHVHALYPSAAAVRRLIEGTGLPLVVSVHGSDLYTNVTRESWAREVRAAAMAARAVVCVSHRLAADLITLASADPARMVVVPDTYDDKRFVYAPREARDGPVHLVSVGRLVRVKGHDVLLRAFGTAVRDGLDATLEIIGAGPEIGPLKTIAEQEGVSARVRFSGELTGEALAMALRSADVFVLPSRSEGFGVAAVEALAIGLPVVATRCGGPQDTVGPHDGALVEPDDAEALAAGIEAVCRKLGSFDRAAIAERARERFAPERVASALVSVYRAIIDGYPLPEELGPILGARS